MNNSQTLKRSRVAQYNPNPDGLPGIFRYSKSLKGKGTSSIKINIILQPPFVSEPSQPLTSLLLHFELSPPWYPPFLCPNNIQFPFSLSSPLASFHLPKLLYHRYSQKNCRIQFKQTVCQTVLVIFLDLGRKIIEPKRREKE